MVIFEGLKPAKSGLLAGPDFGNMKPFSNILPDFENMKTLFSRFRDFFVKPSRISRWGNGSPGPGDPLRCIGPLLGITWYPRARTVRKTVAVLIVDCETQITVAERKGITELRSQSWSYPPGHRQLPVSLYRWVSPSTLPRLWQDVYFCCSTVLGERLGPNGQRYCNQSALTDNILHSLASCMTQPRFLNPTGYSRRFKGVSLTPLIRAK